MQIGHHTMTKMVPSPSAPLLGWGGQHAHSVARLALGPQPPRADI